MWSTFNLTSALVLRKGMPFYAVRVGKKPGIYKTWKECEMQVKSFSGAKYKKFTTLEDAEHFVNTNSCKSSLVDTARTNNGLFESHKVATGTSQKRKAHWDDIERKVTKSEDHLSKSKNDQPCPTVFTDGACSKNGRATPCAGYGVWWGNNHPLNLSRKLEGIQTNQRAEIAAVAAAIKQAIENDHKKIIIKTDSMFVINCLTKWVPGWKKNNWLKSDGKPVVHKKEFVDILNDMKKVEVVFDHVPGHRGVHGNEMADQLAVAGAKL